MREYQPNVSAWDKAMRGPGKAKAKFTILSIEEIRPDTFQVVFDTGAEGQHRARLYPQGGSLESGTYGLSKLTGEDTPEGAKIRKAIAAYKRTREHEPNDDQTWRDVYSREYGAAEGRGLQSWQAREEASRTAWRDYEARTGKPALMRNAGLPAGFDSFDAEDVFGAEMQDPGTGPSAPGAVFSGVKRGDVILVGPQRYEVLQVWDNYHAMVQKPGAKLKAFALRQDRRPEGEVIEVREQRGTPETTLAGPVLAAVPLDAVEVLGAHRPNASGYYVWVLARGSNAPLAEGPWGPYDSLESAKTFARIGATEGAHDRAVSTGLDPKAPSFQIVRRYESGTGERLL